MAKRQPASMRTRQSLSELVEGRLSSPDGRSDLVRLAARLIIEEAFEEESRDALGRDYYERGGLWRTWPSSCWRAACRCAISRTPSQDVGKDESARLLLSKTAVSAIGARLWADYQEFCRRDLGEHEIIYLFVDGIAERIRPGQKREPVLAAWGIATDGKKVLLGLPPGPAGPSAIG